MPPAAAEHEKLAPPQPKFLIGEGASDAENDNNRASAHTRTTSAGTSLHESPPITPRSLTFSIPAQNPFTTFSTQNYYTPDQTPGTSPVPLSMASMNAYPFPDVSSAISSTPRSGATSVSTSVADLTRNYSSFYGSSSRPGTEYGSSTRPLSSRSREAFASPRTRPLTMYSAVQPSEVKIERERAKSTALTPSTTLQKPWLGTRDPYSRIAYLITYAAMFLGIGAGVIRAYTGWHDVSLLTGNLCPVMDEDFSSEDGVFGDNGLFFREVDMSGFGYVCSFFLSAEESNLFNAETESLK